MQKRVCRKLTVSDLPLVLTMEQDFRRNFICEEHARRFLSNPMNWLFACIQDHHIIGFAYGYELNRLNKSGNMLYIHEVSVLEPYHRQGIGRQILTGIQSLCQLIGICKCFLFTQKSNLAACSLYEAVGGEPAHDDDIVYFFKTLEEL